MRKTYQVTANSDPERSWMKVEAMSVFHAAIYYCGACAGRGSGFPVSGPEPSSPCVDGREYRVREARVRDWANGKAEENMLRRLAAGKKPGRA
jgi:hypothetical protein